MRRKRKPRRKPAPPLARRFHRRPGDKLRYWEQIIFIGLHSTDPVKRLWANVLADCFYIIYRIGVGKAVERELRWLRDTRDGCIMYFEELASFFSIDPADVRRDVLSDIENGNIKARLTVC